MQQSRAVELLKANQNAELLRLIRQNNEESRKIAIRLIRAKAPLAGALHKAVTVSDYEVIKCLLDHVKL